jgi:hypothetical protein
LNAPSINVAPRRGERMVTLHDGTSVSSWSPEWMAECEARGILRLPTRERRRYYLDMIERRRGRAARDALERLATAIWRGARSPQDAGDQ